MLKRISLFKKEFKKSLSRLYTNYIWKHDGRKKEEGGQREGGGGPLGFPQDDDDEPFRVQTMMGDDDSCLDVMSDFSGDEVGRGGSMKQ